MKAFERYETIISNIERCMSAFDSVDKLPANHNNSVKLTAKSVGERSWAPKSMNGAIRHASKLHRGSAGALRNRPKACEAVV